MGNNSINDELVAANLKRIRKQQKVTQRQLGERTGKSERTIQNYESGKINFNLEMIQTLASALEIDWKELMNNADSLDKSDSPSNKYPLDSLGDIINVLFQIQQTYDLSLHFSVKNLQLIRTGWQISPFQEKELPNTTQIFVCLWKNGFNK